MYYTYRNCHNLTGNPVCGSNVTDMHDTYFSCHNLTGSPVCGNNVTNMSSTYENCYNLTGNGYFYSSKLNDIDNCFYGRSTSNQLPLYVPSNSTTLTTCLINNTRSMVGANITWTDDTAANGCYYNTTYNIYIYPVTNVAEARIANGD
jgi:YHS domain-containing protein